MSRTSTKRKTGKERIITIEAFTVISYLVLNSSLMFIYALAGGIASIERRFHFDSTTMGRVILANDLGPLGGLLFFSYFANRFNLSHVLGIMGIVYAIGIALFTLPQYIFKYEDDNTESVVINNTILCVNATEKNHLTSQDATDSGTHHIKSAVFGIMFAALFIAGVTIYPLATLPQSYIEWNTRKSRTAIYIAIANLGWATSPLFGFLLSAWCMSMYVDLSETQLTPDDPAWIGAWWLSIVIVSGLTLIPSVFYFVFPKSIDGKTTQLEVKTPDPEETASQTPDAQKLDPDIADKADNKEKQDAHSFKGIVANIIHDCVTLMQVCCHRTCSDCGVDKLTFLPEELQSEGKIVKWSMFDYKVVYQDKEVVEHLKTLLQDFTSHQFRNLWQRDVYLLMKQDLPLKQAIAIHDYSENYSCEFQDQIQSLYFGQQQASIHVTLLFNHAADSTEDIPNILCDHMFVISSDLTHDFNSVHDVRGNVAKYFNDICVQIDVLHEFTDGCSAQYKSRHCLNDLSFSEEDFGFKSVRHFYETSHAKGLQDGAGANLKNFASMYVIKRKIVIRNAKELFNYVSTTFTESRHGKCMNKRVFFYTESVKKCGREVKTVTNVHLRKLHSVQSTGEPNRVQVRNLSCGCPYCLDLDYMHCINKNYVPNRNTLHLTPENMTFRTSRASTPTAAPDADSEDAEDKVIAVSDLITSDSIVALESDELLNPYYLVTVQSGPDVLKDTETDSYGVDHYKGETVFRGHYFKFLKDDRTGKRFTLSLKKFLFYYPGTVRYICSDIQKVGSGKNVYYKLTKVEEIDLIGALEQ